MRLRSRQTRQWRSFSEEEFQPKLDVARFGLGAAPVVTSDYKLKARFSVSSALIQGPFLENRLQGELDLSAVAGAGNHAQAS
jgi:hypothetical protein